MKNLTEKAKRTKLAIVAFSVIAVAGIIGAISLSHIGYVAADNSASNNGPISIGPGVSPPTNGGGEVFLGPLNSSPGGQATPSQSSGNDSLSIPVVLMVVIVAAVAGGIAGVFLFTRKQNATIAYDVPSLPDNTADSEVWQDD